ncbi:MAG: family 43 glycosylhydrolase [Lachnospira sp.]|nr:family 43 glycosylhydrolase [Lachnospira sp.]
MWQPDNGDGTYSNPILFSDYSDPDVIRSGDDFYMTASSFSNVPGLPILHSRDLVHWELINYALRRIPEFRYENPIHGCGVWAPAIRQHGGKFYIYFPMPDEGIYVTTADDPAGAWSEPVNIRPGAGWIDPCPLWDADGRAWLVNALAGSRAHQKNVILLSEMAPDGMRLISEPEVVFDGSENGNTTVEGPKIYRRGGWYYIFAPAGGVKQGWQLVMRSRDIHGPYEYRMVLHQGNTDVNGPHQGAWVDTPAGEDWFIHFQDQEAAGRILHLEPVRWVSDWPVIGAAAPGKSCGVPVKRWNKPKILNDLEKNAALLAGQTKVEPVCSDEFENGEPNLAWQWNANPDPDFVDTKKHGKGLILNAVSASHLRPTGDLRNLLLQKWPAPSFYWECQMDVSDLHDGDRAGIISMGEHYQVLQVRRQGNAYLLETIEGHQEFDRQNCYTEEYRESSILPTSFSEKKEKMIYFRMCVVPSGRAPEGINEHGETVPEHTRWLVSLSAGRTRGEAESIIRREAVPGRWVGVKSGLFCSHDADVKADPGRVCAAWVRYGKNVDQFG